MSYRRGQLQERFERLRKRYFAGRLTGYRAQWATSPIPGKRGELVPRLRLILVAERLRRSPARQVEEILLHEMCHVGCPHHGPRFRAALRRVGLEEEAVAYADQREPHLTQQRLSEDLRNFMVETGRVLTYAEAVTLVAREVFASTRTAARKSRRPNVRKAWATAVTDARLLGFTPRGARP